MKPISVWSLHHHCHINLQMLLPGLLADEHGFQHNPANPPLNKHIKNYIRKKKKRGKNVMAYSMI